MALRIRPVRDLDEYRATLSVIGHYFAWQPTAIEVERLSALMPLDRVFAAFDGDAVVAGCGAYPLDLTVPGGRLPCAGVTIVGVLPSHRRQGLMTRLMRSMHRDIREREEPLAGLWASEETIYERYGYGLATVGLQVRGDRQRIGLRAGLPEREGRVRMVDHDEALETFPRIYDRVRRSHAGVLGRSREWWEIRKLDDHPERRRGGGPLHRVLVEFDDGTAGYALYRVVAAGETDEWRKTVRVIVRVALAARSYATDGRVTLEIAADPGVRDNVGTWTVEGGAVRRSTRRPDVRLDVQTLAAAYLGGFTFAQLAAAERVEEVARGGLRRADALFGTGSQPWCLEGF